MDSYEKLLNKMGSLSLAPRTGSKVEVEILKRLMTPEEAEIACHLSSMPEPAATIAERACMGAVALGEALETMVEKRVIFKVYSEESLYCLSPLHSVLAYQVRTLSPEDAKRWQRYWKDGMAEDLFTNKTPAIRVLPVGKSISTEMSIFSYEEVEELIRDAKTISVADCICRTTKRLIGEGCDAPVRDMCMLLDARGDFYAKTKIGRLISKEEAKEVLSRGREAGLVCSTLNVQKGPNFICNCCGCCCTALRAINELQIPTAVTKSNFIAEIASGECTGCGVCVERCPVRALELVGDIAHLKEERCIGCGVCETMCQFNAISLKRRSEIVHPPADAGEFMVRHAAGRTK
ncbi:MAG: 4Fe-4S binding protein [Syntrophobacteraceae bacterium]